jgi:RNA polymerase sigma-70 factor (ECF subfamily)
VPSSPSDFEHLIRAHARVMAAAIRRVCGRRHGALVPDVQQEVYLALWKRLQSGNPIDHPVSYLYKVALTTALAMVRKLGPDRAAPEEEADLAAAPDARALHPLERARLLAEVLEALEPDEARALKAYLAGFGHAEVARLFGWTESVARHRVYRSMEKLRVRMDVRER